MFVFVGMFFSTMIESDFALIFFLRIAQFLAPKLLGYFLMTLSQIAIAVLFSDFSLWIFAISKAYNPLISFLLKRSFENSKIDRKIVSLSLKVACLFTNFKRCMSVSDNAYKLFCFE